jgi:tripeptide aminopeptidase
MKNDVIEYFMDLVRIDSESAYEIDVALKLAADLKELGFKYEFDQANDNFESNSGNLYGYMPGKIKKAPILFCAHMDTVKPGVGIKPKIVNGKIVSDRTTILGSDDKSGIAEIIFALKELKQEKVETSPVEILFTVSEEVGLLGAKYCDYSKLKSKIGYALDSHEIGSITIGAPSQNNLKFVIHGKEAHAGVNPELGVNAIKIAADAIKAMPSGRIDTETTCNIGIIQGGNATNIVPNEVTIMAEVRSHDQSKLEKVSNQMIKIIEKKVANYRMGDFQANVDTLCKQAYKHFLLDDQSPVVKIASEAAHNLGLPGVISIGGGGSDANIFNENGISVAIAGSGMNNVHTVNEFIMVEDLKKGVRWVKEVIKVYSNS